MNRFYGTVVLTSMLLVLFGGCYGGKMVKMPVTVEEYKALTDSLFTEVAESRAIVEDLQSQLEEERAARIRYEADAQATRVEMAEAIRIMSSRLDDTTQLLLSGGATRRSGSPPVRSTTPVDSASALTNDQAAEELFRAAYLDLSKGNYDLAVTGFTNYLVRHPDGSQLPDVHYYLGESFYAREGYFEALGSFNYVIQEYPDSRLVPAAYLKAGLCYDQLEEKSLAERTYRELIAKHPDSEEAKRARDELGDSGG